MDAFLDYIDTPEALAIYADVDQVWERRVAEFNRRMQNEQLPLRMANLSSIWTVLYTQPSRYNWMLQNYLRAEGLALSWVGTGRLIFSLNYTEPESAIVTDRFVDAAKAMQRDGWWWSSPNVTNKGIRRKIVKELIAHRF